ncbi:hypothetical protein LJC14_07255, partial [Treponema sp. OttesenSCG-928-L16]|nr:hypothetical protein [Treponema sp. OttesenSCG-928-L16]
ITDQEIKNPALKGGICCFSKVSVSGYIPFLSVLKFARESVQRVVPFACNQYSALNLLLLTAAGRCWKSSSRNPSMPMAARFFCGHP